MVWKHVQRHISCGGLTAHIVRGDVYDAAVIATQVDGAEPWLCIPFGKRPAEGLIAIDGRHLIAAGSAGNSHGVFVTVLDAVERKVVSKITLASPVHMGSHFVVAGRGSRLVHVQARAARIWSLPDLTELAPLELPYFEIAECAVRSDGAIIVRARDVHFLYTDDPNPVAPAQIVEIAPDLKGVQGYGGVRLRRWTGVATSHAEFALSPCGRYLVRAHDGSIRLTDADGRTVTDLARYADLAEADIVPALAGLHLHGLQEVWDAAPMAFRGRFVVRSEPLLECMSRPAPTEDLNAVRMALEFSSKRLTKLRAEGRSEQDIAEDRAAHGRLGDVLSSFTAAKRSLQTITQFAGVAPHDGWKIGDDAFFDRVDQSQLVWLHPNMMEPLKVVRGEVQGWLGDGSGFVVRFGDGKQRSVSFEGKLGAIEDGPPEYHQPPDPTPKALRALARVFIRDASVASFRLERLDEASCIAAIAELTRRVRADVNGVIWGHEMKLRFLYPDVESGKDAELDEDAFFAFVGDHCPRAVESLRDLLAAFDQAELEDYVWSTELAQVGGFPAGALAKLDPDCWRDVVGYFDRRDVSHEPYGNEVVFPALAPFRTLDALGFGLAVWIDEYCHGAGGHDDDVACRLFADARPVCKPEEFFLQFRNVMLARFPFDDDDPKEAKQQRKDAVAALLRPADRNHPWDRKLVEVGKRGF